MDRGFASKKRIKKLKEDPSKHFVLRIKNNVHLEMQENGNCIVGKEKGGVEIRVVAFCDMEEKTEFRFATDLPDKGDGAVSNAEIAEIYVQRWQIELVWKFLKMHLKIDRLITKNENGIRIQIYSSIIAYLILQLIEIEEGFGNKLIDKLRYLQCFMGYHGSYGTWLRKIVHAR